MKLGTKGRYAVMAMVDLAGYDHNQLVSLQDLSARQALPLAYLEQLFARLNRQGLVRAVRGPKGGYTLAKKPEETYIADIVAAADEEVKATRCEKGALQGCHGKDGRCMTHDLWEGLDQHIAHYLGVITLADVRAKRLPHMVAS